MGSKFLTAVAAVALLAACETAPETSGDSQSGGASTTTASTSAAPSTPAVQIAPGSQEDLVVNIGDRVFFGFDSSEISAEARTTLSRQAAWLSRFPAVQVVIEGHADERGTREYNLALGDRRANAAKDYLVSLGVSPNRVRTISYGKERPAAIGSNETAWAQNRRAATVVVGAGS